MSGETLACPECGLPMVLREGKNGRRPFWACKSWPDCKGSHGAHDDGTPLGIPADKSTRIMRIAAHETFDRLWKGANSSMTRTQAYVWMSKILGLSKDEAHIGRFDSDLCARLIRAVWKEFPPPDPDPFG